MNSKQDEKYIKVDRHNKETKESQKQRMPPSVHRRNGEKKDAIVKTHRV